MTKLEKLESVNFEVQNLQIEYNIIFFKSLLPKKMESFLKLTYFEDINNKELENYLNHYRNYLLIEGIKFSLESLPNETNWQKDYTLLCCKRYVSDMLYIINLSFKYFKKMDLLYKQENVLT
ncbi:MAG: hypothetical protein GTN67_14285 [Hydrotalea flava]|nr:hypothetical protein [Hydrotalea flava]NIM39313.1 hypothetical protein [Hydrotalea flava]NIN04239.1 hypothetical protein [Hydrotalea flava]NIN16174.1 hypothetical protein [Hydrotalea flava]NIO95239.1 hypothetical protein [Hydrotalea flava]